MHINNAQDNNVHNIDYDNERESRIKVDNQTSDRQNNSQVWEFQTVQYIKSRQDEYQEDSYAHLKTIEE